VRSASPGVKNKVYALKLLTLMVLTLLLAFAPSATAEYGDVVMNDYSEAAGMRPVVFQHWFRRVRFRCKVCHVDLGFELKAGGNQVNMRKITDGQFCGACHNGAIAWSVEHCSLCHSGKPSLPTRLHEMTRQEPSAPVTAAKARPAASAPGQEAAGAPEAPAPAAAPPAPASAAVAEVNTFNRLLRPIARSRPPSVEPGVHGFAHDLTPQLQRPAEAFAALPKATAGNHVDWVKALDAKAITPRWDRINPSTVPTVMDLNVVREVKGSMPDVVFPHKRHTDWLQCANCHPAIFIPQKGANRISKASILLGEKCGVCHGKVAFPVSECRLCHSRNKAGATAAAAGSKR
jgi:c(7)-type cytochrome triheme protein